MSKNKLIAIKHDFENGMSYAKLAKKYGMSKGTISKYKNKYDWKPNRKHSTVNSTKSSTNHSTVSSTVSNDKSDKLSPEQELFCQLVAGRRIPKYRAYQIAYADKKPTMTTATSNSSKLSKMPKIKSKITSILKNTVKKHNWSIDDAVDEMMLMMKQSEADVFQFGIKKANTDSLYNAYDRLCRILGFDKLNAAQVKKAIADAKLKQIQVKNSQTDNDQSMDQLTNLINTVNNGIKNGVAENSAGDDKK